jgi:hypothetical protein
MKTTIQDKRLGKQKLQRIIEMCANIENHSIDPFLIDFEDAIKVIQEYFPKWREFEELNMDSEAIHHLASVIKLQSEWVKQRSTALYTDPFLLEEKILQSGKEEILEEFLRAWHPLIELEQISLHSLSKAMLYWKNLTPIRERWKEFEVPNYSIETTNRDELLRQKVLGDKNFSVKLEEEWQQLKDKINKNGTNGKIFYWDFINAETYEETIERAFLTSFLISYGYATLEIRPLEEEIFIKPLENPSSNLHEQQSISIPIAVTYTRWQKWNRGELD